MTSSFAAFVQHAFNADIKRFRNFMSFDRRWLEEHGSEDSHGRTLWALGTTARHDASSPRRHWAAALFASALPAVEGFASPRAWAFTLLGLDDYCIAMPDDRSAADLRSRLAERLDVLFGQVATADWVWFEEGLSYDNARLSEAMIRVGKSTGRSAYVAIGLQTLDWLIAAQTTAAGLFRPVGTDGFHDVRKPPRKFDQQPVEAAATIAACLAAFRASGDRRWATEAHRAFAWFLGHNDLSTPLVDPETGSCRDGLHPDRRNENRGAESVLSYLLGLVDMRTLERMIAAGKSVDARHRGFRDPLVSIHQQPRGLLAANYIPQSAGPLSST
jgi:hypothetical protein